MYNEDQNNYACDDYDNNDNHDNHDDYINYYNDDTKSGGEKPVGKKYYYYDQHYHLYCHDHDN